TIAGIAAPGGAGDRIDDAGRGIDGAQAAALAREDVDRAVGAELDGAGAEEARLARRPVIAAVLGLAGAGEGVDRARGEIDDADAMIGDIGDVEMPLLGIERETVGLGKPGARRRPAIAGIGRLAGPSQGRDGTVGGVDAADAAI